VSDGTAIRTRGMTKDYGQGHGVFGLDLEVRRGEILGFLGPNGAGKPTTMRLPLDLIRPTAGSARWGWRSSSSWSARCSPPSATRSGG
jgi:ABC-2 type transport system ATP-binding protein